MILYNLTIIIDDAVNREWLEWMNAEFIPRAMKSGLFQSNRLLKVLDSPNEGTTYCLQFVSDSIASYQEFKQNHEPALVSVHATQFADKFVSFNTLMEFID